MSTVLSPLDSLLSFLAGWMNDRHSRVVELVQEWNRFLRRQLGKQRHRLTDDERRRLAAKGVHLGRKLLADGLIAPPSSPSARLGRRARLGGLLYFYFWQPA